MIGWRRIHILVGVLLTLWLGHAAGARAAFTPAALASGTEQLEFDEANAPVLSADGLYMAFQGSVAGVPGVYRRDLQTGEVELVAPGDATAPSISAEGRYVAFTTTVDLEPAKSTGEPGEPEDDRGCPEVYVRDMNVEAPPYDEAEPQASSAYTLASALGEGQGIVYPGGCPSSSSAGFAVAGAQAAPGVALSADGQQVVFTVLSRSNLDAGSECPSEPDRCTEPSQVAVRNLQTRTTTLVTATPQGLPTPEGGAFPSTWSETRSPASNGSVVDQPTDSTAAISADGNAVAWLGTNIPAQVPGAAMEIEEKMHSIAPGQSKAGSEIEPLWRSLEDGSGAVTKRLLNGAGLDFYPQYVEPGEVVEAGSLTSSRIGYFTAPVLSANGQTVAMIANAPSPAAEATLIELRVPSTDAYVVHVEDSAAPPSVTRLTNITDYDAALPALGSIEDIAISPDGTRVAFETSRTLFDLPALALISPLSTYTGVYETYEANIERGTLQRVTSTYNSSEPNGNAGLLSFSGDGQTLAFASEATNLFFGDAIDASEVYSVRELPSDTQVTPQQVSATPGIELPAPVWLLNVTASAAADGSVLVHAEVPGAGKLSVSAAARIPAPRGSASRSDRSHTIAHALASGRERSAENGRQRGGNGDMLLPQRIVAQGQRIASGPSQLQLRLRAKTAYGVLVTSKDGLYAVLSVSFAAPGHKTLVRDIPVTFHRTARKAVARRKTTRRQSTTHRGQTSGKSGTGQ